MLKEGNIKAMYFSRRNHAYETEQYTLIVAFGCLANYHPILLTKRHV